MSATTRTMGRIAAWAAQSGWLSQKVLAMEWGVSATLVSLYHRPADKGGKIMGLDRWVDLLILFVARGESERARELADEVLGLVGLRAVWPEGPTGDARSIRDVALDVADRVHALSAAVRRATADHHIDEDERADLREQLRHVDGELNTLRSLLEMS